MTLPDRFGNIEEGSLLRTGGPPEAILEDLNGIQVPATLYSFGALTDDETVECSHFCGRRVLSMDWEQHPECDGPSGTLRRAKAGGLEHEQAYRLAIEFTRELIHNEQSHRLDVVWWPEPQRDKQPENLAHSHVMLPDGATKKLEKSARRHLRQYTTPA